MPGHPTPHAPAPTDTGLPDGDRRALAEWAQTGLFVVQDGLIAYANPALAEMLHRPSASELLGQPVLVLTAPEYHAHALATIERRLAGKTGRPGSIRGLRADGSTFDAQVFARRIDHAGRPAVLITLFDNSKLQDALRSAEWSAKLLASTEALCGSGAFEVHWPSGELTVSSGFRALIGLPPADVDSHAHNIDALDWVPPGEQPFVSCIWRSATAGEPFEFQHRVSCSDGSTRVVLHRGLLSDHGPAGLRGVAILQDITAQREAELRIQALANHDEVTGLPNRAWMLDQLDAAMHAARWESRGFALLTFDVARIADIKSNMGFGAGDTLAMALAARLREACGEGEIVARLGDTEFAWMADTGPDCDAAQAQISLRASALQAVLEAPVRLGSADVFPLCVIGAALFPHNASTPETLLEAAQTARLDVSDCTGLAFFRPEAGLSAMRAMQIDSALHRALAQNEFALHYQPQVSLDDGVVHGAEALLRWHSAELGSVSPAEFIPIAERSGLIGDIGDWVLRRACEQIVAWRRAGLPPVRVAVNLSPIQLQRPDLARHIQRMLDATGADPECLGVEITESILMDSVDRAAQMLREIRALGIEIALDDFGTGYSSLNNLSRLPIDVVKVDRSFVHDLTADPQQVSVTRAIINMTHGLRMKVLAEGVETEGQLSLLASWGCDQIQGYWFSRPLPAEAFEALLRDGKHLPDRFVTRNQRGRTLLLVDDEPNIVNALKRLLRRDGYHVLTASSGSEGLQLLTEHPVDVILTDQRMPGMTGVEFLHRAKAQSPHTVRMVLSGYTELQSIIDAINEGAIYKFLTKPWDDQRLRGHVAEAFRQKELSDENRRLQDQVEAANNDLAHLNDKLGRLLAQQNAQAELLSASANGFREVLDGLPTPVIGIDPDGLVAYANPAAESTLSDSGGLLGQPMGHALLTQGLSADSGPGQSGLTFNGQRYRLLCNTLQPQGTGPRGQVLLLVPDAGDGEVLAQRADGFLPAPILHDIH
ncbi:MAG: hypothetical protein RJA98_4083 [Pseudomonadota bacterium]|jgi:diguanylate cyclase (GGDEF)-like protein/PAS domain S-box-containing protein